MKIVVINYNELNTSPSSEQVATDVINIYKTCSSTIHENMGSVLKNQVENLINKKTSVVISFMNTSNTAHRNQLAEYVKKEDPDLLVSYNLAGFELGTLTDSLLYNLIDCRQFHIIKKRNLPNEKYLQKLKSINLFIFEDYSE